MKKTGLASSSSSLMQVRQTRLPNGVRVITSTMPQVQSVSLGVWTGTGARHEEARESGISHFIEHLLFKGTRRRSALEISQAIEGRGGNLNAFTQEEATCYYARVPSPHTWIGLDVLTDMFRNALLKSDDIVKERKVIIEEIMMYRDQPHHLVNEKLIEAIWPGHPLGRPISGTPESLNSLKRADLVRFIRERYVPAATVVAFAGKVDHDQCVQHVERSLGGLRPASVPRCKAFTSAVKQNRSVFHQKPIEQSHLSIGFRLFGHRDTRRYPLRVMNAILGENSSSRLYQVVREKHGMAYAVHSTFWLFDDTGAFVVNAGLDRRRTAKAVRLVVDELKKLREKPVTQSELARAKEYVVGSLQLGLESTSHQMLWLGDNILSYDRFIPPEETIAAIQNVKAADITRLAREFFHGEGASIALVHPELPADEIDRMKHTIDNMKRT